MASEYYENFWYILYFFISFIGMIVSGLFWSNICDIYGRRKVVIYGFLGNAVCYIAASLSQNFTTFMITKFLSGFMWVVNKSTFLVKVKDLKYNQR